MRYLLLLWPAAVALADEPSAETRSDDARPPYEAFDATSPATTHETIYETIDEAYIGRVFLSREERRRLDEARAQPVGGSGEDKGVAVESPRRDTGAAGFIRVPGKAPQVFRRGRFVPADLSSTAGQRHVDRRAGIVIERHEAVDAAERDETTEARGP